MTELALSDAEPPARFRAPPLRTAGAKTLDTATRLADGRYSGDRGYTPEQWQQTMAEAAGLDLGGWFADVVSGTTDLDFTEALEFYGPRFAPVDLETARATMGASTRADNAEASVGVGSAARRP